MLKLRSCPSKMFGYAGSMFEPYVFIGQANSGTQTLGYSKKAPEDYAGTEDLIKYITLFSIFRALLY